MSYAAIMVYVDTSNYAAARIKLACDVAKTFDACIIGISASVPALPITTPSRPGAVGSVNTAPQQDNVESDLRFSEQQFRRIAGQHGCRLEWRYSIDNPAHFVAHEARAADLIMVGRTTSELSPHNLAEPADLLLAGRPVLVVPPVIGTGPLGTDAIIAWKDRREARRAVLDALPLLRKSRSACVVEIASPDSEATARQRTNDVVVFLSRHGIKAEASVRPDNGRSLAQQILAVAIQKHAGLIVMGGQAHGRLHDWTIGGDTYEMLKQTPVCLLISN